MGIAHHPVVLSRFGIGPPAARGFAIGDFAGNTRGIEIAAAARERMRGVLEPAVQRLIELSRVNTAVGETEIEAARSELSALAAGNRVMIKMSESTPRTGALLEELIDADLAAMEAERYLEHHGQ